MSRYLADLACWERVATPEEPIVLSHAVVNHVQWQRNLHVVVVVDPRTQRSAVLLSPDVALPALTIYRYDKARFHIAFLFRDAKQFTGLTDCPARSQAKLHGHCNASLTAVSLAKLTTQQQPHGHDGPLSMARLKRRAFKQPRLDRIRDHVADGASLEKYSPAYESLCHYGTILALAA